MGDRFYFEGEELADSWGDLSAGEFGEYGSDDWFEVLTELATDAKWLIGEYDHYASPPDSYYVLAKVITALHAQHRYHRGPHHDWAHCDVCSPKFMDSMADMDFGSDTEPE